MKTITYGRLQRNQDGVVVVVGGHRLSSLCFLPPTISQYQKRKRQMEMRNEGKTGRKEESQDSERNKLSSQVEQPGKRRRRHPSLPPSICPFTFPSHHSLKTKCCRLRPRSGGRPPAWLRP